MPLDHRVDPVAVALGVGQPLQHDHAEPFAEHRAVGGVENGRQSPVGESAGVLLKHMYMKMSLNVSTPPVITRSDVPEAQLDRSPVESPPASSRTPRRRRSWCRPGRSGWRCARRPRCRAGRGRGFLPRHVRLGDPLADRLDLGLGEAALPQGPAPRSGRRSRLASGATSSWPTGDAEDHADPRAIDPRRVALRRVLEHLLRDDQRQQLRGVGRGEVRRRDAELQRVELDRARNPPRRA